MIWTLLQPPAETVSPTNQWILIAMGVLTLLYIVFVRPNRKPKSRDPLAFQAQAGSNLAQQRSIEREMANLLVEYEGMIRRMTAQLDTRATRLELLIADADERIATLRALVETATASATRGVGDAQRLLPDGGQNSGGSDRRAAADEDVAEGEESPPPPGEEPVDRRHQEIYDLADGGLSARQIAQQLGRPNGEVDLILALRGARP